MFSKITKWKAYGVLAAIFSGMMLYIKLITSKNKRLEHKNKINEKVKEIHEEQILDTKEVLNEEPGKIEQRVKDSAGKSRRDRASRL